MCMVGLVGLVVVVGLDAVYVYVYDSFAIWSKGPSTLYRERFAYATAGQQFAGNVWFPKTSFNWTLKGDVYTRVGGGERVAALQGF